MEPNIKKEQGPIIQDIPFVGINGEQIGLGFSTRDQGAKQEEDQGILEFRIITNDRTQENMKLLIDLKNIFSRQLPKMPKEYIVKLVFDRNHQAMIITKNKTKIIGGICYRQYPTQKFAEVAFLAVTATEQVKGYGTRLMNKFKEHMQKIGVEYLMTYADNFAIGYFKKQGFTKEYRMAQERWKGYIKDYEGGTLMECKIHPYIDYNNISYTIKEQKNFIIEQVRSLCFNEKIFPGIDFDSIDDKKMRQEGKTLINPYEIPGIQASGWNQTDFDDLQKSKERSFNLMCQNILENMRKHKCSWPFREPVSKTDVPDYYDVIQDPIDLSTIQKKLQMNFYYDKEPFIKDIKRLFSNCRTYNQPETIYYKAANDLEEYIAPFLNSLKDSKTNLRENSQGAKRKNQKKIKV